MIDLKFLSFGESSILWLKDRGLFLSTSKQE